MLHLLIAILLCLPALAAQSVRHVRTTMEFADALRALGPGDELVVHGGRYPFVAPFVLDEHTSGTAAAPITIRAAPGERVVFDGAVRLDPGAFAPVTDTDERRRLAAAAADHIVVQTIDDPALLARLSRTLMLGIGIDGRIYLPARFPNSGHALLDPRAVVPEVSPPAVPVGKEGYGVRAGNAPFQEPGKPQGWLGSLAEPRGAWARFATRDEERAGTWEQWQAELQRNNQRNLLDGFLDANWLQRSQPLVAASAERHAIHLSSALAYGWAWRKRDKACWIYGLLCELDQPGEWHFDPATRRLYLYPPQPLAPATAIDVPVANGFLHLRGCRHLRVIGLHVENVAAGDVYLLAGSDNLLAGGSIRRCTACGVRITGRRERVSGCDLVDLHHHIALAGGHRSADAIVAGDNSVDNCHCYQRHFRDRRVSIGIDGVGNVLRNNLIHNSLGQSVTVRGNDHRIERNELFNIGFDEGDGGAIYAGADLCGYGVIYRHNFIHHLMHVPGKVERSGIHLDDLQAGATCIGNIFYKSAGKGIFMNGGAGHVVRDNVFLAGFRGIYNVGHGAQKTYDRQCAIDADPDHPYRNTKENYVGRVERIVGERGWTKDPWRSRYPTFYEVMSDAGRFGRLWPIRCRIENNLFYDNDRGNHTIWSRVAPEARAKSVITGDREISPDVFVDYEALDLRFLPGRPDLPDIPFESIGLKIDRFRRSMPDKTHYRRALRDFFDGVRSMPGTTRRIDTGLLVEQGPIIRG